MSRMADAAAIRPIPRARRRRTENICCGSVSLISHEPTCQLLKTWGLRFEPWALSHSMYAPHMGRRLAIVLLWAVSGYFVGAFGGGYAISVLSTNTHDSSVEAAMTGAFVTGPIGAVLGALVGALRAKLPGSPRLRARD